MTRRRDDLLRLLRDLGRPAGIAEIAEALGVHPNTVRFHLDILVESGQVERTVAEAGGPGRPAQLFASVPRMDPTGPRRYQVLADVLLADLATGGDPERRAALAGQAWGRAQASSSAGLGRTQARDTDGPDDTDETVEAGESVERLVRMLDDLGFAPEVTPVGNSDEDGGRVDGGDGGPRGDVPAIGLRHCPFLELAFVRSEVVCPIHLGLMRGALESWGAPVQVDRLEPFAQPDLCVTHLSWVGKR